LNKLRKIIIFSLAIAAGVVVLDGLCFAYDDEGFQFWSKANISFDINKGWKCTFEEEFKLGDDGGQLYYHHSDVGFIYKRLADWIDLGFNYRQAFEKDGKGTWRSENRPHLNMTLKSKLFNLGISNRSRIEYRDREYKKDVWRYRNKTAVKLPIELTALGLQPYLADEIFITLDDDNVDENRFYSGVSFGLSKTIMGELYYLWQTSRTAIEWKDINVFGFGLKLLF